MLLHETSRLSILSCSSFIIVVSNVKSELQAKSITFQINLVLKSMKSFPKIDEALYPKAFAFNLQS